MARLESPPCPNGPRGERWSRTTDDRSPAIRSPDREPGALHARHPTAPGARGPHRSPPTPGRAGPDGHSPHRRAVAPSRPGRAVLPRFTIGALRDLARARPRADLLPLCGSSPAPMRATHPMTPPARHHGEPPRVPHSANRSPRSCCARRARLGTSVLVTHRSACCAGAHGASPPSRVTERSAARRLVRRPFAPPRHCS